MKRTTPDWLHQVAVYFGLAEEREGERQAPATYLSRTPAMMFAIFIAGVIGVLVGLRHSGEAGFTWLLAIALALNLEPEIRRFDDRWPLAIAFLSTWLPYAALFSGLSAIWFDEKSLWLAVASGIIFATLMAGHSAYDRYRELPRPQAPPAAR